MKAPKHGQEIPKNVTPMQQVYLQRCMGQRMKAARKANELTSDQLAELCYINATYLRQIEAGKKTPSLPVFICLCNILKTSPAYLLEDFLVDIPNDQDIFSRLRVTASPCQRKMIAAMIESALDYVL